MFEDIPFYTVKFSDARIPDSLAGIRNLSEFFSADTPDKQNQMFFEDCSFLLDGISHVCPQHPISDLAKEKLFYIQSFAIQESGASYYTRRKNLDSFLLSYTHEGTGELLYEGMKYTLTPDSVFIIDCHAPHQYQTSENFWKHSDLHFNGCCTAQLYREYIQENKNLYRPGTGSKFCSMLEELVRTYVSITPYREYMTSSILNSLLLTLLTTSPSYTQNLSKVPEQLKYLVHYIDNNYMNNLSIDFLSSFCGLSKYHLCRVFKKYIGFTLNDYITQIRIDRAKDMLQTTTLPVNKIGAIVGVSNENYFYRLFKAKTGISPGEYRKLQINS